MLGLAPGAVLAQGDAPAEGVIISDAPRDDGSSEGKDDGSNGTGTSSADDLTGQLGEAQGIPDSSKLRTPHSPAFILLGASPTLIARPTTPVDFAVALTADWGNNAGELTLPRNLAIEVAPYWWFRHRMLTFDDYMNAPWWSNVLRNTSLSIGTSSQDVLVIDETVTTTRLAFGVQTQLYTGHSRAEICAGDVQGKAMKLATRLIREQASESVGRPDELLLAAVEKEVWAAMAEILADREAAQARLERADKVIKDPASPHERRAQALRDKEAAQAALDKATAELEELVQSSKERLDILSQRLEQAQKAVDQAKTPEEKQEAERELASARRGKSAAEREVAVSGSWRTMTAAQARTNRQEAATRETTLAREMEEAAERRKERVLFASSNLLQEMVELCKDASAARHGWNVAVAGALSLVFPDSTFASRELDSWATWLTVSYSWKQGTTLASLLRLVNLRLDEDTRDATLDAGGRVIQAKGRYAASVEGIRRFLAEDNGWRAAVTGEYMVRKGTWLSISFGKDFTDDGAIFSLANLNWGFGGEPTLQ